MLELCGYGPILTNDKTNYPSITFKCTNPITIKYSNKAEVKTSYTVSDFTTALQLAGLRKYFLLFIIF